MKIFLFSVSLCLCGKNSQRQKRTSSFPFQPRRSNYFLILFFLLPLCVFAGGKSSENAEEAKLYEQAKELFEKKQFLDAHTFLIKSLKQDPYEAKAITLYLEVLSKINIAAERRQYYPLEKYVSNKEIKTFKYPFLKHPKRNIDKYFDMIVPKIRMENKEMNDVVAFIRKFTEENSKDGKSLNIIYDDREYSYYYISSAEEEFEEEDFDEEEGFDEEDADDIDYGPVNFECENVSVRTILRLALGASGSAYIIDENIIYVFNAGIDYGWYYPTRVYKVSPKLIRHISSKPPGSNEFNQDLKSYIESFGIKIHRSENIRFLPKVNKFIVNFALTNVPKIEHIMQVIKEMEKLDKAGASNPGITKSAIPKIRENPLTEKLIIFSFFTGSILMFFLFKVRW